jgi:pyrroline-5-carboxylate reductase
VSEAPCRVGVIGVGHLVSHMMPKLVEGNASFLLSERSRGVSARLAARLGLAVSADNQAIVEDSEVVLLAVRPADALGVLKPLRFRAGQTLVSVCAGVPLADLGPAAHPARVVLVMPVVAAEFGESATLVYPRTRPCAASSSLAAR